MLHAYAKLSHWISVKDQLPVVGRNVLVNGGMAYMGAPGQWFNSYVNREIQWEVTHWMPLPDPPPAVPAPVDPRPADKLALTCSLEYLKDSISAKNGTNAANSWWDLTRFLCGNLK